MSYDHGAYCNAHVASAPEVPVEENTSSAESSLSSSPGARR